VSSAPESGAAISTVRGPLRTIAHQAAPPGTTALVGGVTAVYVDIQAAVNHDYLIVFPVAALLIMIILGLLLRSVVAPWYLIVSVGLILTGTFASLTLAGNSTLTQMGFAIAFGIAIAAFVMALFFTPALTALIGHAAWWPGHGDAAAHPTEPGDDNRQTYAPARPA
jgi:putative drug exporter of the RND superfamily